LVETFGTGRIPDEELLRLVQRHFDLRPAAILAHFQLQELPRQRGGRFYQNVAVYGHFGQTHLDLPWERTDKADLLREEALSSSSVALP
jgi:S-adenosylmethionine synthetase